jgi:gliding motility-associated-like protein
MPGQVITCNLQSGIIFDQGFAVFIDWNQNNVFDLPQERVAATPNVPPAGTFTQISFTVPAGQATGQYRMRVRCAYSTPGVNIGPCQLYGFGETEDYEVFCNLDPVPIAGTIAAQSDTVCIGQSANLTLSGQNGTIQWQSQNPQTGQWQDIPGQTLVNLTQTINTPTCFRAALTACGSTIFTQPICISVAQQPQLVINSPTICEGDSTLLLLTPSILGGQYQWTTGSTNNPIWVSPNQTTTYGVVYTVGGCQTTIQSIVSVNPNPQINIIGDSILCQGDAGQLVVVGGNNWIWTGGQTTQSINIIGQTTQSYNVISNSPNGCQSTDSILVIVNPLPVAQFQSTNTCEGNPTIITSLASVSSGQISNILWYLNNTYLGQGDTLIWQSPGAGTFPITQIVISSDSCQSQITQNIVVWANPQPTFTSNIQIGCVPVCVDFFDGSQVTNSQISNWIWTANGNQISTLPQPNVCFNDTGKFDIGLVVTSLQGCQSSILINDFIKVNPIPVADFTFNNPLVSISEATIQFNNQSGGATEYLWNFPTETSQLENPIYQFTDAGIWCILLEASDSIGCKDTITKCLEVYINFYVYIPNTFTPNKDGTNDVFQISGTGIKQVSLEIFNRWGQLIFTKTGSYDNVFWTGYHQSSLLKFQQGVYVYKAEVMDHNGVYHEFIGHVNLLD